MEKRPSESMSSPDISISSLDGQKSSPRAVSISSAAIEPVLFM